jgi:hypothetical protein
MFSYENLSTEKITSDFNSLPPFTDSLGFLKSKRKLKFSKDFDFAATFGEEVKEE